jgi:FG-GAP-like repeat
VNGDARKDLVTLSSRYGESFSTVSVLLNRGHGRFGAARQYRSGSDSDPVAIGDLDGDGKLDLVTADSETVSVLLNQGDGRFPARREYAAEKYPFDVAIGDLNGDGKADLATANTDNPRGGSLSSVSVFINKGDGNFENRVDRQVGRQPFSVAIADLNRDGERDVVTANLSDSVSVFMNGGDGSFRPRVDYRAGSGPRSIAIGDMNGDRRPDVVTANSNSAPDGERAESVSVLLNKGDGSFRPKLDYRTGGERKLSFNSVAIGDLNQDGKPDVAIGDNQRTVSVLLNSGGGRLKNRIDYSTRPGANGVGVHSVAIGDLNRDGKLDLVTLKPASVLVLLNTTRG